MQLEFPENFILLQPLPYHTHTHTHTHTYFAQVVKLVDTLL